MKKYRRILLIALVWFSVSTPSYAGDKLMTGLLQLQHDWAITQYQAAENKREEAFEQLVSRAAMLVSQYPDRAEPLVWQAIITSTQAGVAGGLGALKLVKQARKLLLDAEKINPDVLQGSVYTSLGSLYYQVPGWPIGFGDDDKAEKYLQHALSINPRGIDPNFFYADFLFGQGRYGEAMDYVRRAIKAPARQDRPLADKGRQKEARELMKKIQQKLALQNDNKMELFA